VFLSPLTVLPALRIPAKPRVGDFGAGQGHYAFALAERVGRGGTIYALDAFEPNLDALKRGGGAYGSRFYALRSDLNRHIPLKTNLLNAGIVANVLHQLSDKEQFVSELARVMEPEAQVLVVDWLGSFKNMGPPQEAILAPGEAVRLFEGAGFSAGPMLSAGTHHFAFVATSHLP
jgi:ubiquinone/menaquinone biosynthesis C-methylase UbiE